MQEQAILKMGLDVRDVEASAARASRAVQEVGEHGHKSFVHAGSAAKGFHKILESVTEASPIAGRALSIAISPIAGLFAAAAAGAGFLHEKIKELNQEYDRIGEAAAKPLGNAKDRARETAKAVAELRLEQDKYSRSLKTAEGDKILHTLKDSMAKVDDKAKAALGLGADPVSTERTRLQITFKMQEDALKAIAEAKRKATDEVETWERIQMNNTKDQRIQKAKEAIEGEKKERERIEDELKKKREAAKSTSGVIWDAIKNAVGLGPGATELAKERVGEIRRLEGDKKASEEREQAQKKFIDEAELRSKAANMMLEESKSRREKLRGQFEQMDEASAVTLRQLKSLPLSPGQALNTPTRDALLGTTAIQARIDDAQRKNQQAWTTFYRDNGMTSPETNMAGFSSRIGANEVNRLLQEMLNRMQNGVAVFGKE